MTYTDQMCSQESVYKLSPFSFYKIIITQNNISNQKLYETTLAIRTHAKNFKYTSCPLQNNPKSNMGYYGNFTDAKTVS